MSGPQVAVEVILLRVRTSEWSYRRVTAPLLGQIDPCDLARDLAGGPTLLHSTSWRHQPGEGLILTYAAYPDPDEGAPALPLDELTVAYGEQPDRPRPAALGVDQVAAHAIRHLAFLATTDPVIIDAVAGDEALAGTLPHVPAELATRA